MSLSTLKTYWADRRKRLGDGSVGRKGEDHVQQGLRIAKHLTPCLDRFFEHGLDFGCGYGRMMPYLVPVCGHVWAVDLFEDWAVRAAGPYKTATPVEIRTLTLPFPDDSMDLIVDIMTTQGLDLAEERHVFADFARIGRPGTTIISLSNKEPEWLTLMTWANDPIVWRLRDVDKAGDRYCLTVGCLL